MGEVIQSVNGTDCSYCSTDHLADLLLGPEGFHLACSRSLSLFRTPSCSLLHSSFVSLLADMFSPTLLLCFHVCDSRMCCSTNRISGQCVDNCARRAAQVHQSRAWSSGLPRSFSRSLALSLYFVTPFRSFYLFVPSLVSLRILCVFTFSVTPLSCAAHVCAHVCCSVRSGMRARNYTNRQRERKRSRRFSSPKCTSQEAKRTHQEAHRHRQWPPTPTECMVRPNRP